MNNEEKSVCYRMKMVLFDMDKNPYKSIESYMGKPKRGRPTNAERERRKNYNEWHERNTIRPHGFLNSLLK